MSSANTTKPYTVERLLQLLLLVGVLRLDMDPSFGLDGEIQYHLSRRRRGTPVTD